MPTTEKPTGLALLRVPFPPHQISKLPKPKSKDAPKGKCHECGGWHGLPAVHLDYVGHAALTDRLLDADPGWTWEPLSVDDKGLPALDANGGLWIRLTVCAVTRLGYGDAQGKSGGDAMKERIGDALRNAAMRFGAALDLWHKGDLHRDEEPEPDDKPNSLENQLKASLKAVSGVKPTADAGLGMSDEKKAELDDIALHLIELHRAGKDLDAIRIWYAPDTFDDNEERIYVWSRMATESKLRSAIKSNNPHLLPAKA